MTVGHLAELVAAALLGIGIGVSLTMAVLVVGAVVREKAERRDNEPHV